MLRRLGSSPVLSVFTVRVRVEQSVTQRVARSEKSVADNKKDLDRAELMSEASV
ncbi:MAG: hypothetical protein ACRDRL_28275 [Sciscionella sp.]